MTIAGFTLKNQLSLSVEYKSTTVALIQTAKHFYTFSLKYILLVLFSENVSIRKKDSRTELIERI